MGPNLSTAKHLFSKIRRLVHLVRVKGIRRIVKVGFESYVFAYSRFILSYKSLAGVPFPAEENDFHCRLATMDDLERLKVFEPYRWRSEFREWLSNGGWVFIALDGEFPIAFNVASIAPFLQPPWSRISLRKHRVWSVDAYTLPSHRRRGAGRALTKYKDGFLATKGFRQSVSFRRASDEAAAATWTNIPHQKIYRLTYFRILFFSKTWLESATTASVPASLQGPREPTM